jgi:hypothetical protein
MPVAAGNLARWVSGALMTAAARVAAWCGRAASLFAGPKLELTLRPGTGDVSHWADGRTELFHHITVTNRRQWSPARDVRILVVGLARRGPDGAFHPEPLAVPQPLAWAFTGGQVRLPTLARRDLCEFGFLGEHAGRFKLATRADADEFRGFVLAGEAMRVEVAASARNTSSRPALTLEVAWDGGWADVREMHRHLAIREVAPAG